MNCRPLIFQGSRLHNTHHQLCLCPLGEIPLKGNKNVHLLFIHLLPFATLHQNDFARMLQFETVAPCDVTNSGHTPPTLVASRPAGCRPRPVVLKSIRFSRRRQTGGQMCCFLLNQKKIHSRMTNEDLKMWLL